MDKTQRFYYMMLSRLAQDCDFYLGHGRRDAVYSLYHQDEETQINEMIEIYGRLRIKPEWMSMKKISKYARRMGVKIPGMGWKMLKDFFIRFVQGV
ncbi:MAG: LPD11 domain-containing protein [Candidatus Cryptobacteroides sp.]